MSTIAIARPITTLMFFGVNALRNLSISLYPNVDVPIITITTFYPGANPEIIEGKITDKIEEAISGIESLKKITSLSADSVSVVAAEFELEKPIEIAANDVRDKVSGVSFGSEVKSPIVEKVNIGGAPIISLFITPKESFANTQETLAFHTYVNGNIKPLLQRIKGVGKVNLVGFLEREIRIYPNLGALNKYNLSFNDIAYAVSTQNIEIDGGRLVDKQREWRLVTKADAQNIQGLEDIIVANNIKLGDIARVEDSTQEARSFSSLGLKSDTYEGILLEIQKITGANEIEIAKAVQELLPILQEQNAEYSIKIVRNTTSYIQDSINAVEFDLILGAFLAVFIVFFFLRNIRITFISSLSIPASILGTFACMQLFGMTLNLATMIALTLAIGIIIDDAIVVIENIYKKLELGLSKLEAAYEGVKEISFALIAISAMLLAVFFPIANLSGVVGRFFTSFSITLVAAILISYGIVITFIPMLSARIANAKKSLFYHKSEKYFKALEILYIRLLEWVLARYILVIVGIFSLFVVSLFLITRLGVEFLPAEDKAEFDIKILAKPGISLEEMQRQSLEIQKFLENIKEVEYSLLNIGFTSEKKVYEAKIYVRLVPYNKRERKQKQIIESLRDSYKAFAKNFNIDITIIEIPQISLGEDDSPFQMAMYSLDNESLKQSLQKLLDFMQSSGKFLDIHTDIKDKTPEYRIIINRAIASEYGFSAKEIALVLNSAFSGSGAISYYRENGKEYDIVLLSPQKSQILDLQSLSLRNAKGENVFLSGLIVIEEISGVTSIKHYDRQRSVIVYANLSDGISLGEATKFVEEQKGEWLDKGVNYKIEGYAKYLKETNAAFITASLSAFVLIYFILAALYESLLQPFIVMVTLPLSFTGAFLALFLSNEPLSLFSIMGLLLLMGLVGKNATLIIDVANQKRAEKMGLEDSILQAGELRLRPILMTTFAMIFGMLPLALSAGAGSAIKSPMGIAMIGGLSLSMFLSLLIVPAFYKLLAPLDEKIRSFYK